MIEQICTFVDPKSGKRCDQLAKGRAGGHGPFCQRHRGQFYHRGKDLSKLEPLRIPLRERTCIWYDPNTNQTCGLPASANSGGKGPFCLGHSNQFRKYKGNISKMFPVTTVKERRKQNRKIHQEYTLECWPGLTPESLQKKIKVLGISIIGKLRRNKKSGRVEFNLERDGKWETMHFSRHLMELKVGRKMSRQEDVDHIDENPLNDHIDNLQILTNVENLQKAHDHRRKDQRWCQNVCVICGSDFERSTSSYRHYWGHRDMARATCSSSCTHFYVYARNRFPSCFHLHFQGVIGRFLSKKSTKSDKSDLKNRNFVITKGVRERFEKIQLDFREQVELHEPYMKKEPEYSPKLLQFLRSRLNDFGREDWSHFYRGFLPNVESLSMEKRLEFVFRTVYPFDPSKGKQMTYLLFNAL